MVPFKMDKRYVIKSIAAEGDYTVDETIAVLTDDEGRDIPVTMVQKWPVKRAVPGYSSKPRPFKLLETGVRCIDTLNPITEGGTGFIPGPFGTGKTVLQHAISKQAEADVVIIAACVNVQMRLLRFSRSFQNLMTPYRTQAY